MNAKQKKIKDKNNKKHINKIIIKFKKKFAIFENKNGSQRSLNEKNNCYLGKLRVFFVMVLSSN